MGGGVSRAPGAGLPLQPGGVVGVPPPSGDAAAAAAAAANGGSGGGAGGAKGCQFCSYCLARGRATPPFHWCCDDRVVPGFRGPSPYGPIGPRAGAGGGRAPPPPQGGAQGGAPRAAPTDAPPQGPLGGQPAAPVEVGAL